MHNGRLPRGQMARTSRMIRDDNVVHARVFRGRRGSETQVAEFKTRYAAVGAATLSRDVQAVIGDAAPQVYVFSAPGGIPIQKGDEIWAADARYRVIAVDSTPGAQQVITQHIQ